MKPAKRMLGDKAYDSAELRDELDERGTKPVIPNRNNRKQPFRFSKRLYKLRWRIESAFNRLKDFRRIATRYDRLARNTRPLSASSQRWYGGFNERPSSMLDQAWNTVRLGICAPLMRF